jgi:MYXO-CTERM domain-containing protein
MIKTGVAITLATALFGCIEGESGVEETLEQVEVTPSGSPYFLRGEMDRLTGDLTPDLDLTAALPTVSGRIGLTSTSEVRIRRVEHDELGMTHVRVTQRKNNLRVVSGDAILHLDSTGVIRSVDNGFVDRDLTDVPALDEARAIQIAVQSTTGGTAATTGELVYVISNRDGELYLAWEVRVTGSDDGLPISDLVYVDALGDRVIDRHPRIFTARNRTIRNGNNGVFPVANAPVVGTEAQPPTDQVALAAFTNTGITYDCYKTLYNRDSYDNAGATLNSQVHVVFETGNGGTSPNNAVWAADLETMAYGDGDGTLMRPLALSLDVTAHELTHAVTTATANLVYQNESGALNESMSDIFGAVCEAFSKNQVNAATFLIGDDIYTPNVPNDALRYMDNPTRDGYSPDNYAERLLIADDNGGVHGNSGIPNLAFYLLSNGGKHPRNKTNILVPAIGLEQAGQIFHRALTTKMTPNTNMAQARTAIEQSADELFPGTCAKPAISLAFAAVGVGPAPAPDATPPTVSISSPASGANVSAGFQVQAATTDDQCITKVELLVDGAVVQTLTKAPFTFTAATSLANGPHELVVKSYDTANTATSASVRINLGAGGGASGDGSGDLTGGCSTGSNGGGFGLALLGLGLALARRRR